jgi:ribosome-binding protein aMBF1 (putative translation factor)
MISIKRLSKSIITLFKNGSEMSKIRKKSKKPDPEQQRWLKQLGGTVKDLRLKQGLSQTDLASKIPMDAQNISRIERGLVNTSAFAVKKICDLLKISLTDFYNSFSKK